MVPRSWQRPGPMILANDTGKLAPPSFADVSAVQHYPGTDQEPPPAVLIFRLAAIASLEQLRPLSVLGTLPALCAATTLPES
jgi:hypothetical protein